MDIITAVTDLIHLITQKARTLIQKHTKKHMTPYITMTEITTHRILTIDMGTAIQHIKFTGDQAHRQYITIITTGITADTKGQIRTELMDTQQLVIIVPDQILTD